MREFVRRIHAAVMLRYLTVLAFGGPTAIALAMIWPASTIVAVVVVAAAAAVGDVFRRRRRPRTHADPTPS